MVALFKVRKGAEMLLFLYKYFCDYLKSRTMNNRKYFYVYYSYEPWGRGYIGKRECECLPEEDVKYFGSYRDKTFKPTEKIILEVFGSRKEAYKAEKELHDFYQVDVNPHFANKSKITDEKFYYVASGKHNHFYGRHHTEETRELIRSKNKGKPQDEDVVKRRIKSSLKYKYLFISPNNERYETTNANQFCIDNRLNSSAVSQVVKGSWSNHQGWKIIRIAKNLEFTEDYIQEHLKKLAWVSRKNGENQIGRKDTKETKKKKSLANKGKKKSKESIGKRTNSFCKYIWTFTSPEGKIYESYNCNELCRELNLCQVGIGRVARGVKLDYKGWKVTRRPRSEEDK